MDWTYDLYFTDIHTYGVEDEGGSYNAYFVALIKRAAEKFLREWKEQHNDRLYDHGWVGDAFASDIADWFSDFYKDTYGQRPHLPMWFYIHPLGLPMREDTARTFCADPGRDACNAAAAVRAKFD